jgi:hypothetical protein
LIDHPEIAFLIFTDPDLLNHIDVPNFRSACHGSADTANARRKRAYAVDHHLFQHPPREVAQSHIVRRAVLTSAKDASDKFEELGARWYVVRGMKRASTSRSAPADLDF